VSEVDDWVTSQEDVDFESYRSGLNDLYEDTKYKPQSSDESWIEF
jgi:hypothetical protein